MTKDEIEIPSYPNLEQLPKEAQLLALKRSTLAIMHEAASLDWGIVCLKQQLVKLQNTPAAPLIQNSITLIEIRIDKCIEQCVSFYKEMEKLK